MKKQAGLLFIAFSIAFIAGCSPEIVFTRGHESALTPQIYRMKADGTQETNISQSVFSSAFPDASPAGNTIAFSSGTIAGGSVGNVHLMPVNGGERTQLTAGTFQKAFPRWGLREYGKRIVYSQLGDGGTRRLYIVDTNGAAYVLTNPGPDYADTAADIFYNPADGLYKVIFSRTHLPTQRKRLFFINADGTGEARMITKDIHDDEEMPVVSHNGRFVAYRATRNTADSYFEAVRVMTVNDWQPASEIKLRVPDQINIRGIGWSRSDRRLYVSMETSDVTDVQYTEERAEIFSMTLHGADQKRLTKNKVPDYWPNGVPCSPGFWQFQCALADAITGE
jgi:Tol biopolymer transport system component